MKQVIQDFRTGRLSVEEVPPPAPGAGGVLVRTTRSLISAGTERMVVDLARKSLLGKAVERPDLVKQVLDKVRRDGIWETVRTVQSRLETAIPLGYSCSGAVLEVGRDAAGFEKGDRVACAGGGYANHAEVVFVPKNLAVKIPGEVDFESAAFVTVGAIALQGVRVAEASLGDRVGVIGLGLIGQITVQLLAAAGCRVFGIDIRPSRAELALRLGASQTGTGSSQDVLDAVARFTDGHGLDAVLIAAASDDSGPVELAGRISRERGRVVAIGAVRMEIPRQDYYRKELEFRLSRSYGPGRYDPLYEEKGIDYPYGYVRWTEKRNMDSFVGLLEQGKVDVKPLVTHRYPIADALQAYETLTEGRESCLGIILTYDTPEEVAQKARVELRPEKRARPKGAQEGTGVSVIGAGRFAQSTLLPILKKEGNVRLRGIASAKGLSAGTAGKRFGFDFSTSDIEEILRDEQCEAVLIATRHNLHAPLACRAMDAGKHVLVEKPLALNEDELNRVLEAHRGTDRLLMVGFNRRFAPLARLLKRHFEGRTEPLTIGYRINAGPVPFDSWIRDPAEGGGRVVGEVCHFVDLMAFLCDAVPQVVYAQAVTSNDQTDDSLNIQVRFKDGTIGTIGYWSNGDVSYPKEYMEVFSGGRIGVLDDFSELILVRDRQRRRTRDRQDKGHREELRAFLGAVREGAGSPIPLDDAAAVTLATFCIHESLRTGSPVDIADVRRSITPIA